MLFDCDGMPCYRVLFTLSRGQASRCPEPVLSPAVRFWGVPIMSGGNGGTNHDFDQRSLWGEARIARAGLLQPEPDSSPRRQH